MRGKRENEMVEKNKKVKGERKFIRDKVRINMNES